MKCAAEWADLKVEGTSEDAPEDARSPSVLSVLMRS
jgi:hypothetical protein